MLRGEPPRPPPLMVRAISTEQLITVISLFYFGFFFSLSPPSLVPRSQDVVVSNRSSNAFALVTGQLFGEARERGRQRNKNERKSNNVYAVGRSRRRRRRRRVDHDRHTGLDEMKDERRRKCNAIERPRARVPRLINTCAPHRLRGRDDGAIISIARVDPRHDDPSIDPRTHLRHRRDRMAETRFFAIDDAQLRIVTRRERYAQTRPRELTDTDSSPRTVVADNRVPPSGRFRATTSRF